MLIKDPDKARRLARSICADIQLYNAEAMQPGNTEALGTAIWEGHDLFTSRVSPALESFYEEAVRELMSLELVQLPRRSGGEAQPMGHPPTGREAQGGGMAVVLVAVAILLLAVGGAFFLFAR